MEDQASKNQDELPLEDFWLRASGIKREHKTYSLSVAQAQEILRSIGIEGHTRVTTAHEYNHVYRVHCDNETFFLKTFTKGWYTDPNSSSYCVEHEQSAWHILASHGIASPDVLLAAQDENNPFGKPFILTKKIQGEPLDTLLKRATGQETHALLHTLGDYLRQMHAITFSYPGYLMRDDGPKGPPDENAWQHGIWTAKQCQKDALAWLQAMRSTVSDAMAQHLEQRLATIAQELATDYTPLRFVHGDCHLEQFFFQQENGYWQVTGVTDMEVSSAGASVVDVLSVCRELAQTLPFHTRWWESLFAGYGSTPNFERFQLRLLGIWYPYEPNVWPGSGDNGSNHILTATNWDELFSSTHLQEKIV